MKAGPSYRFLGLPPGTPPRTLLALPEGPLTPALVEDALRRQRARGPRPPAAGAPPPAALLRELEAAAAALKTVLAAGPTPPREALPPGSQRAAAAGPKRPMPQPPRLDLTAFDREVLAALAEGRGWNERTRAKVQAIAARFGVSAAGVTKVMNGLAGAMRDGSLHDVAAEVPRESVARMWVRPAPSRVSQAIDQLDEAFAREVSGTTPGSVVRLLLVFVGVAAIGAYLLVQALSAPTPGAAPPTAANLPSTELSAAEQARAIAPPAAPAVPIERSDVVTPTRWAKPPLLAGSPPPPEAVAAEREARVAPEALGAVGRKLQLAANQPSPAHLRDWAALQQAAGRSWPRIDSSTRAAIVETSVASLRPIESESAASSLLGVFEVATAPLATAEGEALAVWRGAWSAGMLGEMATRTTSTAVVRGQAIDRLDLVVPRQALARGGSPNVFDSAAGAWLDAAAPTLVEALQEGPQVASRAADHWERWIEAQRVVRSGGALQGAWLEAIGAVLRSTVPINEGLGAELLGRLVSLVDWTERSPDQVRARDAVTVWFTDERIPSARLWVLTSLLDLSHETAWFVPELVAAPDADRPGRGAALEKILAAWPAALTGGAASAVAVDPGLLDRWRAGLARADGLSAIDDASRLSAALAFARLNVAAQAFLVADQDAARSAIEEFEREIATPSDRSGARLLPGRPTGSDGEFAAAYQEAGRDEAKRQEVLRGLRARPGAGDLGVRDAETLVNEAFRGTPADVRQLAQTVITDRFSVGPVVIQELLDQVDLAPQSEAIAQFLEQTLATRLPDPRSPDWRRAMRLAMVRRLMALEPASTHAIDAMAEELAANYVERSRLVRVGFESTVDRVTPAEALARLVRQWRLRADSLFFSEPFPAPLAELDRRRGVRLRLAEGGVQQAVAEQTALIELMAAVAVAERGALRDAAGRVLRETADRRARSGSALEQVLEGERGMARLADLWFAPAAAPVAGASPRSPAAEPPAAEAPAEAAPGPQPSNAERAVPPRPTPAPLTPVKRGSP
jgi:hypothetical protein